MSDDNNVSTKKQDIHDDNQQEKLVPNLRFPEFTDEWKKIRLSDNCNIVMGQSPSSKNYTKNSNDTILIQGNADLENGKIKPRLYTTEITKKSEKGDIILTVRAPVGDLAINEYSVCIGRGVCSIKSKNNIFIYYILENLKRKHIWERLSQGSTFESINSNDIENISFYNPSENEQNKISNFLSLIDRKIEYLEKSLILNEQTLKYYSQILLKDIEYNYYNEYKIKNILINQSSNLRINELNENNGIYPLYGANGFLKNINFCEQKQDYIAIVKDGSGVGNLFLFNKNSSIVGTMEYLIPKNGFNIFYIYYLLKTINLNKYKIGSSIPHIYFKDYSKEKVKIPSLNTQMNIGTLLNNIKIKSNIINTKIKYLKNFKNGLMQKMFI